MYDCTYADYHSLVQVERRDDFGECEILGNGSWHAHLVDTEIRIRRDNRTSREIHSFPHQITPNSAFFTLQTDLHRFQWSTGLLHGLEKTRVLNFSHGKCLFYNVFDCFP